MTFYAQNIEFLRKENGYSQAELGKILQIDRATISGWEGGKYPTVEMLLKISSFFEVEIGDLFYKNLSLQLTVNEAKNKPNSINLIENKINLTSGFSNLSAHSSPVRTQTLYGVVANAGEAVPSDLWHEQEALSVPGAPHGGIIVKVHGDSMYPTIHSDDYIVCTRLESTQDIKWQDIHLVITSQSMVYVKRLRLHTRGIELCSDNHQVGSIYLQREEIVQVWHVMFKVSSLMRLQPPTTDLTARISYIEAYLSAIFGDFTAGQPPV